MGEVKAVPDAVDTTPARALADAKAAERRAWLLREGWTGVVLAALIIGFALWSPEFFGKLNWLNTSSTATEVLLLALGETFVIIAGGIDLSVGAVLGLAGMVGGWVMSDLMAGGTAVPLTVAAGFAAALAVGLAFGLLNGWLIARHNIPAFVVTLGTLGIATGLGNLVYNGQEISAIPTWVGVFGNTNLLGWIPVPVLIAAVLCVITGLALAKTRYGSNTYAIGDSREAAIRAGLRWQRHLVKIYAVSGLLAGIDGVLVMSRLGAASPTSGITDNLNAIAAVVIGGASLFGGRGKILGSIIGTLIISVLLTGDVSHDPNDHAARGRVAGHGGASRLRFQFPRRYQFQSELQFRGPRPGGVHSRRYRSRRMRKSIATVSVSGTLPEKLAAIAQARFHGVEIFESDLVNSPFPPERIRWQAADLGLSIELYQPFRDFEAMPPDRFAANLKRAERKFDVMERLGADTMLVCSNVSPDAIGDDALAAQHLYALAERAAARGLMIAYEALAWGRHVREYQHSWEIVRAAGHPALGVCLDSFHILSRGSDPAGIRRVPGEKIFFLQLADAPLLAMDVLQWSRHHRCFPGQGGFDLTGFVGHVLAAGYRGPLSLEVFSDTFRQAEPESTALDAMRSLLYLEESLRVRLEHGGAPAFQDPAQRLPGPVDLFAPPPGPVPPPAGQSFQSLAGPPAPVRSGLGLRGDRRGGGGRAGPGRHAARTGLHPGRRALDQERHPVAAWCGVPCPEHRPGRGSRPRRIPARPAAHRAGPAHHRQRRSRRPGRAVPRTCPAAPTGQRRGRSALGPDPRRDDAVVLPER